MLQRLRLAWEDGDDTDSAGSGGGAGDGGYDGEPVRLLGRPVWPQQNWCAGAAPVACEEDRWARDLLPSCPRVPPAAPALAHTQSLAGDASAGGIGPITYRGPLPAPPPSQGGASAGHAHAQYTNDPYLLSLSLSGTLDTFLPVSAAAAAGDSAAAPERDFIPDADADADATAAAALSPEQAVAAAAAAAASAGAAPHSMTRALLAGQPFGAGTGVPCAASAVSGLGKTLSLPASSTVASAPATAPQQRLSSPGSPRHRLTISAAVAGPAAAARQRRDASLAATALQPVSPSFAAASPSSAAAAAAAVREAALLGAAVDLRAAALTSPLFPPAGSAPALEAAAAAQAEAAAALAAATLVHPVRQPAAPTAHAQDEARLRQTELSALLRERKVRAALADAQKKAAAEAARFAEFQAELAGRDYALARSGKAVLVQRPAGRRLVPIAPLPNVRIPAESETAPAAVVAAANAAAAAAAAAAAGGRRAPRAASAAVAAAAAAAAASATASATAAGLGSAGGKADAGAVLSEADAARVAAAAVQAATAAGVTQWAVQPALSQSVQPAPGVTLKQANIVKTGGKRAPPAPSANDATDGSGSAGEADLPPLQYATMTLTQYLAAIGAPSAGFAASSTAAPAAAAVAAAAAPATAAAAKPAAATDAAAATPTNASVGAATAQKPVASSPAPASLSAAPASLPPILPPHGHNGAHGHSQTPLAYSQVQTHAPLARPLVHHSAGTASASSASAQGSQSSPRSQSPPAKQRSSAALAAELRADPGRGVVAFRPQPPLGDRVRRGVSTTASATVLAAAAGDARAAHGVAGAARTRAKAELAATMGADGAQTVAAAHLQQQQQQMHAQNPLQPQQATTVTATELAGMLFQARSSVA